MLRNALKLLVAAGNTAQHETGFRRKPKLARNPHFMGFLLAIPAGLEPATRGVEIRYSIQLSYGTVSAAAFIALQI